ncbi:MAG: tRNA uridine-5-carboxymethylaminomethyl(34) synthesis GTPase MnmE [Armatimonas sp.]
MSETIAAISTAAGGGIGIVRLSGADSLRIASLAAGNPTSPPGQLRRARIKDAQGELLDDGMLVVFQAPRSYTGEDMAEFHGHGGAQTLSAVLERFLELGARLALPGEFTERAFLSGKLDLTQAEGVADLVAARTDDARRAALRQLTGGLKDATHAIEHFLKIALAFIEATIDFPDDVGELDTPAVRHTLNDAERELQKLLATARRGRALSEGLTLAIVGQPNVGKSSLLNALAGTERAIVTDIPGTTRDVVSENLSIGGYPVRTLDTAGLRETEDIVEAMGVERARNAAASADVVLVVADATLGIGPVERDLLEEHAGRTLLLLNKCDLAAPPADFTGISLSAKTGNGLEALGNSVRSLLGDSDQATIPMVTRARHENALRRALESVRAALNSLEADQAPEFIAVDCHGALMALGELTGETSRAEIIEGIFRTFCIGK